MTIFSETFEDVSFTKAFEKWLSLTNGQEGPLDGVTMIPWEMGEQLVRDVMVVDALAHSRLSQCRPSESCNPGTTATEAEAREIEKYRELIDNRYIFQPVYLGSTGFFRREQ